MVNLKDIITLDSDAIKRNEFMITKTASEIFVYENQQKTDKLAGWKIEAVCISEELEELSMIFRIAALEKPGFKIGQKFYFEIDNEKSKVYVSKGFLNASVWVKSYQEVDKKNDFLSQALNASSNVVRGV